jgi:hypothetical protein
MPALQCDQCDHCFPVPTGAGEKVRCPQCRAFVRVPAAGVVPVSVGRAGVSNAAVARRVVGVGGTLAYWVFLAILILTAVLVLAILPALMG